MRHLAIALAAAALLGVPALALGVGGNERRPNFVEDGVQVTAVGRVENIRAERVFTLSTRRMTFTVVMRPGANVLGDRLFLGDRRLREGDRVRVTGDLAESGRIIAEDVDILPGGGNRPGRGLEGTLRNLDIPGRRFVLAAPNGNLRMTFDEDTDWIRNRQEVSPRQFQNGDAVRVAATPRGGGEYLVRRVIMGGDPGWENRAVGEIVELNRRNDTAEIDFDGRVETVDMSKATIRRFARTIRFEDLRTGMDVRVQGTREGRGRVNATAVDVTRVFGDDAGELRTIEGRINNINVESRTIRVNQTVGGDIRVEIDESTRVVRGAEQVRPAALREGQRVRIRGRVVRGILGRDALEALRIEIL